MKIFQKTSHALVWLVFSFLLFSCRNNSEEEERKRLFRDVFVVYKDTSAVALQISRDLFKNASDDSISRSLTVHLEGNSIPVLGALTIRDDKVLFEPVMELTNGLTYEIRLGGTPIITRTISLELVPMQTHVRSVYPSIDTLPENLLKFYIEFSEPMQEGHALENLVVIRNGKDTVRDVFPDLQLELWNNDNRSLTIWLDPGRIKRDLQPNQKMGNPLQQDNTYELLIKKSWRDAKGNDLGDSYQKKFVVRTRDSLSPDPRSWSLLPPRAGTTGALAIHFHESLDYQLLRNTMRVIDRAGNAVGVHFTTEKNETILLAYPYKEWKPGDYTLEIEARLEDLAGNNLNRPFDRDITKKDNGESKEVYLRPFSIR